MKYQLNLEKFSGPIEKLLELIELKKMEVTEVNLANVTADFLQYLKKIEAVEPRMLADFVVVAAALLLIKSKALLPNLELTKEDEEDIKDLEGRIKRYAEFKPAIALFKEFYEKGNFSVSRPFLYNSEPVFYPAPNVSKNSLLQSASEVFRVFNQTILESQTVEISLVKLEEKIEEIVNKMREGISRFSEVTHKKSRSEVVVLFLALLHLLKEQIIKVEQKEKFDDIKIEKA